MCRNSHNEENLVHFKCDVPELNKTLVFNSSLNIKQVIRNKLYFDNYTHARYYFLDSLKKIIAEIWVQKNSCLDTVEYENYILHEIHYQQLFQSYNYSLSKKDYYPYNFFTYSFLETKKGNLLVAKNSLNPDKIPENIARGFEDEIESFKPEKKIFSANMGFLLDSFQISFSIYTSTPDTSNAQIEKILFPIFNSFKLY